MNRRGPGLLGAAARTAVVAGTASAVSGRVQRRQQARFAEDDSEQMAEEQMRQQMQMQAAQQQAAQQQAAQQQAAQQQAAQAPADDLIGQLERLAELKKQGILTDAEFEAQKARLLAE
ncbi:SHOCT domain-containing protein (plasmid) [Streptomyces sp. NBC_00184]|uniref:SHOCT domain-containing protein n=1 Tax=unclassified Streptomyces TaxID=2593676 RepID=UPI002E27EFE8|nr:SHOCT domain-containing protein [Streptomyces sp. NBC_00184]